MEMNLLKTKMLTKNINEEQRAYLQQQTEKEVKRKTRYLGIIFSNKISSLYRDNYEKVLKEVQEDLIKWEKIHLSLIGKITLIKMNILPRVLFLFQTIPINVDKSLFPNFSGTPKPQE